MIWIDRTIEEIKKRFSQEIAHGTPLIIRDEKTLSGRVHVGSLRGVVIHAIIAQILKGDSIECKNLFELNDFDPMDGLPEEYNETHKQYMGQPLYTVPSPEHGHENYPMVFGDELKAVVSPMKLPIEWVFPRPLYQEGKFNECIRDALEHAAAIRTIYKEVSGGDKPDDWYPLHVVCEHCGKIGTTQVTGWNGENVSYICKNDLVEWAQGCGTTGTMDPFNGRAKLPWKVDWAAKWKVYGVHIEGCGKDHSSAGGSRAIAARISEEIFAYPNPFDVPYEFLNIGGKKMSSSKGLGASAKAIADLLPPHLLKLLMIRTVPNRPIDFDPQGKTIPHLFDEYDRLSDHYFKRHQEPNPDFSRTFRLAQLDPIQEPEDLWQMRFTVLSFVLQMPHLRLSEEAEKLKGAALSTAEQNVLEVRKHYVQQWLTAFASEEYKFTLLDEPPSDLNLSEEQRDAIALIAGTIADPSFSYDGPTLHETIHGIKEKLNLPPKDLFQPLYRMFWNRKNGPQIGWALSTFSKEKLLWFLQHPRVTG